MAMLESAGSKPDPGAERLPVRYGYQTHSLLSEAQDIAPSWYLERDVRVNSNKELAPPKEKLQELHI